MSRQRFVEMARDAIVALPQDLKTAQRLVEDPDLDDALRKVVAGAILHVLSGGNAIPGARGVVHHVGDILLLRIVLQRVRAASGDAFQSQIDDAPALFASIDEDLAVAKDFLGEGLAVLELVADGVGSIVHHGHSAAACTADGDSSTWLYDEIQEAIVERFEFDEETVARDLKDVDRIVTTLKNRAASLKP